MENIISITIELLSDPKQGRIVNGYSWFFQEKFRHF